MTLVKILLVAIGTISLCIGIVGIITPGLPTTPFILLTAGLYIKSSDTLYQKLVSNSLLGSYIREYNTKKGMTLKAKYIAICTMCIMIALSCVFLINSLAVKLIIISVGIIGVLVMALVVPTANSSDSQNQ